MNHSQAEEYCIKEFNGIISPIYVSINDTYEVMERYFWWSKSNMNTERIRFGARYYFVGYDRTDGALYTKYEHTEALIKDVDMDIWNRSFPQDTTKFFASYETYDPLYPSIHPAIDHYISINPKSLKWSNANISEKIPFVCEVPRFPKVYCESGWRLHMKSRSCFKLHDVSLHYKEAAMNCRELKSNLASINDKTENELALRIIKSTPRQGDKYVWFGLRHEASRSHNAPQAPKDKTSEAYGEYFKTYLGYNVDGTPVSNFTYFGKDQPNGILLQKENCFVYHFEFEGNWKREWHDYNCESTFAWSLCRKMASTIPYKQ
uniref:C-type lectin domain-containing protein n=1 Tax=Panagrolaimus davidi TaxID=227884 RepID=A0A914Q807_9BILA